MKYLKEKQSGRGKEAGIIYNELELQDYLTLTLEQQIKRFSIRTKMNLFRNIFSRYTQIKPEFYNKRKKIPHTGNTRPPRTCVIQEYRFYTMSLIQ